MNLQPRSIAILQGTFTVSVLHSMNTRWGHVEH